MPKEPIVLGPQSDAKTLYTRSKKVRYAVIALVSVIILAGSYAVARANYPLFHSLADMVTVFIAASVFLVVWNGRRLLDNHYFLFVSISFVFFAFLDFMHLLGNKNMGVFPQYGNLGPTLYIASRYLIAISLLLAPLFIKRKLNSAIMFSAYSVVITLTMLSIFYWKNFPVTYVEGVGLTAFKVISDYIVCVILLGAIGVLIAVRRAFDPKVLRMIIYSLILSIATGLSFTLYTDPFGIMNMVGHFFQIASFALVYFAFVETTLTKPQDILYRSLKQSKEETLNLNTELGKLNANLQRDISQRQKTEEALRQSEKKYRDLFSNMAEEVHFWKLERDAQGQIKTWRLVDVNPPALATWGRQTVDEIRGKTTDEIFGQGSTEHFMPVVQKIMNEGVPHSYEDYFPNLDKYFRFTSVPMGEYFITTGVDITKVKQNEESLRRFAAELASSNKELEAFSYSVSHDLRAPLRSINGFSRILLEDYGDKLDTKAKEYLNYIESSGKLMTQLIDDMLRLSRVGQAELNFEPVNLSEMAQVIVEELRHTQPERRAEFVIPAGITINGDKALLKILLQNLLENAWKYTGRKDEAKIEFGSEQRDKEKVFYVKDNGVGFDMTHADRLFRPFQRLHSSSEYPGTGIGLAIAQRIVNRHGGKLWADSKVGEGSIFYFSL